MTSLLEKNVIFVIGVALTHFSTFFCGYFYTNTEYVSYVNVLLALYVSYHLR